MDSVTLLRNVTLLQNPSNVAIVLQIAACRVLTMRFTQVQNLSNAAVLLQNSLILNPYYCCSKDVKRQNPLS